MISFRQFILESPKELDSYDYNSNSIPKNKFTAKDISSGKKQLKVKSKLNPKGESTSEINKISSFGDYEFARAHKNFKKSHVTDDKHWDYIYHPKHDKPLVKIKPIKNTEARPATFYAIHKPTGDVHMKVEGQYTPSSKKFQISCLSGHPDSKIKAHEFYHHLVLAGHVKELHSDETQSIGGKKVWSRLRKMPNVKVVTSDNPKGHHLKNFEKHYSTYAKEKEILKKYEVEKHDPGWASHKETDWKKAEKDKEYIKHKTLIKRHFIAKSKV